MNKFKGALSIYLNEFAFKAIQTAKTFNAQVAYCV